MRTLIVEDESSLREQLAQHLQAEGFAVDAAGDGEEGLYFGREYDYDAAVIDLGLPKIDGIDLITRLRAEDRGFPILVLTARDMRHYEEFTQRFFFENPNIRRFHTMVVMDTVKRGLHVPIADAG